MYLEHTHTIPIFPFLRVLCTEHRRTFLRSPLLRSTHISGIQQHPPPGALLFPICQMLSELSAVQLATDGCTKPFSDAKKRWELASPPYPGAYSRISRLNVLCLFHFFHSLLMEMFDQASTQAPSRSRPFADSMRYPDPVCHVVLCRICRM